jgi:DNA repair exonuclease SbcCD ATPase subunit
LTGGRGAHPPANSPFARALNDRREIERALDEAQAKLAALEGHRSAIAALRDQRAILLSDGRDRLITQRLAAAKAALEAAEISRAERARATAERRAAESLALQARGARERFEAEITECLGLDASIRTLESDLASQEEEVRKAEHDRSAARDRRAATAAEVAGLRAHLHAQELEALQSELAAADAVAETIAAAEASLAVATTSPELLASLATAERQLAVIDQKLAASAATITFDIEPAAVMRVRIAGDTEPASGSRAVIGPTVIDIEGIGRITVTPGMSADRARDLITREHLAREIVDSLSRAGAATIADALAIEGRRSAKAAERDAARAVLAARLPGGRARLIERITRLADTVASGRRPLVHMPLEQARERLSVLERDLVEADRAAHAAEQVLAAKGMARAEAASALTAARRRRDDLAGRMPPPEERTAVMSRLRDEEMTAQSRVNATIRDSRAFDETAIDEAGFARLRSAVAAEEQAMAAHRHTLSDLARKLASHEGAVAALGGEGLEERVGERAADLVRVSAAVHRFERDRAALQRLSTLLGEVVATTRSRFLAPVQVRLDPLLVQVLPDARLALGDDFSTHSLERQGVAEPTERLSGGTREQLSVLVRLALGRLLADCGQPAPLILDDPFVFADDERLERMFVALHAASLMHQVVVLSCHARSFAPLVERHGGRLLGLMPWHDTRA